MNDWLSLAGRTVLVTGLRNRKSVAWHTGAALREAGALPVFTVHTAARRDEVARLTGDAPCLVCDVADQASIDALAVEVQRRGLRLAGLVHSIAQAAYRPGADGGPRLFHQTARADFLHAIDVSCFSLIALTEALRPALEPDASVVAVSISTTRMASENYGYMAPVKAALDSAVVFLAKSLKSCSRARCNAVAPGLLRTSSSAGIPGYLESLLYAERATLRGRGVQTAEVADAIVFLLSPRSAGIDAQSLVIDAGMGVNFFDRELVRRAVREDGA